MKTLTILITLTLTLILTPFTAQATKADPYGAWRSGMDRYWAQRDYQRNLAYQYWLESQYAPKYYYVPQQRRRVNCSTTQIGDYLYTNCY